MQTRSQTRNQSQTQSQEGVSRRETHPRKVKRTSYLDMFDSDDEDCDTSSSLSSPPDSADSDYENDDYRLPIFNFDEARRAWHADLRKRAGTRDLIHEFHQDLETIKRTRSPPARYRDNQ